MNTTVKSLQDVYVALGGSLTDTYEDIAGGVPVSDYTTIPDVIEAISQLAGKTLELPKTTGADTGKLLVVNEDGDWDKGDAPEELPDVTATDNGSVLSVVNGAWAKKSTAYTESDYQNVNTDVMGKTTIDFSEHPFTDEMLVLVNATLSNSNSSVKLTYSYYGIDNDIFTIEVGNVAFLKEIKLKMVGSNKAIISCGEIAKEFNLEIAGTAVPSFSFAVSSSGEKFNSGYYKIYTK